MTTETADVDPARRPVAGVSSGEVSETTERGVASDTSDVAPTVGSLETAPQGAADSSVAEEHSEVSTPSEERSESIRSPTVAAEAAVESADVDPAPDAETKVAGDPPAPAVSSREEQPAPRPAPSVPALESRPVFYTGGACPECKKGEWALIVERRIAPGGEGIACAEDRSALVQTVIDDVIAGGAGLEEWGGTFGDSYGNGLASAIPWADENPALAALNRGGSCQDFVAVLPRRARFVGFRFEVREGNLRSDCFGEAECDLGDARWSGNPEIERTLVHTFVHASFVNESASRERTARMVLLFMPRPDWQAP